MIVTYGRDFLLRPQQDRAMGGIQTALLGLCTALARRGHDVHVFANCSDPGTHNGAHFHVRSEFARFTKTCRADVLIAIPELLPLLMPVRARVRVVWTGNAFTTGDCALAVPLAWGEGRTPCGEGAHLYPMSLLRPYIDRVVVGSRWQAQHLAAASGIPGEQFTVAYLGVPLEYYRGPGPTRHRHRLVYTSQARRGLGILLHLFPRVRAEVPDAELHIFGCEYGKADGSQDLGEALRGAPQPGVYWRGAVSKSTLAQELRAAALMAYPCIFRETFCLAVAEAQAAGLPAVTSDRAALAERVADGVDGFLIPGRPGKPKNDGAFVHAVVRLLREDNLWQQLGAEAARKAHRLYDWDVIAAGWERELERLCAAREPRTPPSNPALNLLGPSWLTVTEGGATAQVPPALAGQCLRQAWTSYGYGPGAIPGLPEEDSPGPHGWPETAAPALRPQGKGE
jgi:glycosyltransferase involved in cell wall biosynthesis